MKRRVVIAIGIERCGNLPRLPGAVRGAKQFADWATKQSYNTVELFTDELDRKVRFDDIRAKVKRAVDALDVGRLILFFAGHGCSSALGDSWLLSNYNTDSDQVISVTSFTRVGVELIKSRSSPMSVEMQREDSRSSRSDPFFKNCSVRPCPHNGTDLPRPISTPLPRRFLGSGLKLGLRTLNPMASSRIA